MASLAPVLLGVVLFTVCSVSRMANSSENDTVFKQDEKVLGVKSLSSCVHSRLHGAVRDGDVVAVNRLIEEGADIYGLDCEGRTPMHIAVLRETDEMVLALVRNRFDVNRRFGKGNTVLFHAAGSGREQPLRTLMAVGAIVDFVNAEDFTPLYEAVVGHRIDTARVLVSLGADPSKKLPGGNTYLHRATEQGNFDVAYYLAGIGVPVDTANGAGEKPLTKAVIDDNPSLVNLLLARGADIKRVDCQGDTYVHLAARISSDEALQALLEYGASVDAVNSRDQTPMTVAAEKGSTVIIEILLNNKADVNRLNGNGDTYVHVSARYNSTNALRKFLERGVEVDSVNDRNETPLAIGVKMNSPSVINVLLGFKADLLRMSAGQTYLHLALENRSREALRVLLEHGLPADMKSSTGETPMMQIAWSGDLASAEILTDFGADLHQQFYDDGRNLLHEATRAGSTASIRWFVQKGLSVDSTNRDGHSPLHYAVWFEQLDSAKTLVELGCCINCANYDLKTPLRLAIDFNREAMAAYLRSVGGTEELEVQDIHT